MKNVTSFNECRTAALVITVSYITIILWNISVRLVAWKWKGIQLSLLSTNQSLWRLVKVFKTKCTYQRYHTTDNVADGFKSDEEMWRAFLYYSYDTSIENPGSFILYPDICGYVQNKGYSNQSNPLGYYVGTICWSSGISESLCYLLFNGTKLDKYHRVFNLQYH